MPDHLCISCEKRPPEGTADLCGECIAAVTGDPEYSTTNLGQYLDGVGFTPDPAALAAFGDQAKAYVATLPDATGEFSGFYEVPPGEDLGPLAAAFAIGPPRFIISTTLNAPEGHRYTQDEVDGYLGRRIEAKPFPDQPTLIGHITAATASEDGATVDIIGEVSPE